MGNTKHKPVVYKMHSNTVLSVWDLRLGRRELWR